MQSPRSAVAILGPFAAFDIAEQRLGASLTCRASCSCPMLLASMASTGVSVLPNVRAKRATTAGRQGPVGENVPRTADRALVTCRWRSA